MKVRDFFPTTRVQLVLDYRKEVCTQRYVYV